MEIMRLYLERFVREFVLFNLFGRSILFVCVSCFDLCLVQIRFWSYLRISLPEQSDRVWGNSQLPQNLSVELKLQVIYHINGQFLCNIKRYIVIYLL